MFARTLRIGPVAVMLLAAVPAGAVDEAVLTAPGADPALTRQLESASLVLAAVREERTEPADLLAAARAEYRRLVGTLYGAGHYSPRISVRVDGREAADLSPVQPPARIDRIEITVEPGPQFSFSRAEVAPLAPDTELPAGFAVGAPAAARVIGDAADAAVDAWRAEGHAKATLAEERVVAYHPDARLDVQMEIAPGPRLRFGALVIGGNEDVRTERIRAIAGLPVGEVYDPEALRDVAERLRRTSAFRSVSVSDGEEIGPGDTLPIDLTVAERQPRRIGAGLEISSDEGLRATGYWMHRNLLGGAERLRFDAVVSDVGASDADNGIDGLVEVGFRRPATFTPDTELHLEAGAFFVDDPGVTGIGGEVAGGVDHIFSDTLTGSARLSYNFARLEDAFGERDVNYLSLPLAVTWDTRDDTLDATEGFYVDLETQPFLGLSNVDSGVHTTLDARAYRGFDIGETADRVVLAGRLQLGSLAGPAIEDAPSDTLFFAGGGGSVRGQPYRSVGSGEEDGEIVGGRSYLALSAEVRTKVTERIGVVAFADAGYVGAEQFPDAESGNWLTGAGLGVRYDTGFGPIRVDLATPTSGGPDDRDWVELYIGIGQAF